MNINLTFSLSAVTIVLIILKALGYIEFGWLWVFSPLWMPLAIIIGVMVLLSIISFILFIVGFIIKILDR